MKSLSRLIESEVQLGDESSTDMVVEGKTKENEVKSEVYCTLRFHLVPRGDTINLRVKALLAVGVLRIGPVWRLA